MRPLPVVLSLVWVCAASHAQDGGATPVPADSLAVSSDSVTAPTDSVATGPEDLCSSTHSDSTGTTLQDFYCGAIEYSPRLGIAAENLSLHKARNAAALGQLLPQLTASANVTENRREALGREQEFRGERYSLQLNQVLFDGAAIAAKMRAARLEAMHRTQYSHDLSQLLADVVERYLDVLQAQDAVESIRAELASVSSQVEQVQRLYDRQLAPITHLRRAQASQASVRAEAIRLQSELDMARESLLHASGVSVGQLHALHDEADAPPLADSLAHWEQLALENNLQIQAGRLSLQAADAGLRQAQAGSLPSLSLVGLRQRSDVGFDNTPIQETDISYVGISASLPLFSGGVQRANRRQASSQQAIARHELHQAQLDARERVRAAYLQLQYGQSLAAAAEANVESTALIEMSMQEELAMGRVTHVAVLEAIRDRFEAQRHLQEVRYGNIRTFLQLKHKAGTLTTADLIQVSSWFEGPER